MQFTTESINDKVELWMEALKKGVNKDQKIIDEKIKNHSHEIRIMKDVTIKDLGEKVNNNSERLARVEVNVSDIKEDINEIKNGQNKIEKSIEDSSKVILNEIRRKT
jgi:uncharacterized membrane-anchored protein YjiN (DUF445 family)